MRLGSWNLSPRLWAVFAYLSVLMCMLWLGNWQLNRAAFKVSMQASAEMARNSPAVPILSITDLQAASSSYQRVSLQGQYDAPHQFLWDNRTLNGRAGFEVIVPMKLAGGQWVLVNRGWVAPGVSRQALPDVSLADNIVGADVVIEGVLSMPSKGFAKGDAVDAQGSWPRLLQYFDYDAISKVLGEPVLPVVVQAQAVGIDGVDVTVFVDRPEWLEANWQPAASGPAKHYSYAFQWFAMAIALTILFLVVNTTKVSRPASENV